MKQIVGLLKTTLLTATISASATGIVHGGNTANGIPMKPLQGITFAAGPKRAVGYFYTENKRCKLVVTVAETPAEDGDIFNVFRHEANIQAGRSDQFDLSEGQTLEFFCANDAQKMLIRSVENIASGPVK